LPCTVRLARGVHYRQSAPAFPVGLALHGGEGLRLGQVPFARHAPARALADEVIE